MPYHCGCEAGNDFRQSLYAPELLESRIAPATFLVTSLHDNGADGTLRKEILDANAAPGADTIVFKIPAAILPGSIVLGGTEIPITKPLTIKGPGIDVLTVNAKRFLPHLQDHQGPSISVVKTTIANNTAGEFGGMRASGLGPKASVVIDSCVISNNTATVGSGGGIRITTMSRASSPATLRAMAAAFFTTPEPSIRWTLSPSTSSRATPPAPVRTSA